MMEEKSVLDMAFEMESGERKSVAEGKSVDLGGRRIIKKKEERVKMMGKEAVLKSAFEMESG
jgi:hypothetical protein